MAENKMSDMMTAIRALALCVAYIIISSGLINFNKYLMTKGRFPYAMTITMFHMAMSTICCMLYYMVNPKHFPAMEKTKGKKLQLVKWFVPLGSFFAIGLYFSNQAYLYCNVTFLQFMKETNVVLVFLFSCAAGMQVLNRQRVVVIAWIIAGASMAVTGEAKFSLFGFLIQAVSQLGECSKNVMGEWILSGSDMKLDPLTYTMFMAPVCMGVVMAGHIFTWDPQIIDSFAAWWYLLIPNAMLAFVLNVTIATLIKECSAMAFIFSGLVKDMFIVICSSLAFGEYVSFQQTVGFTVTLGGIFFWSYMKMAPDAPSVVLFERVLGLDRRIGKLGGQDSTSRTSEKTPIAKADKV